MKCNHSYIISITLSPSIACKHLITNQVVLHFSFSKIENNRALRYLVLYLYLHVI